MTFGPWNSAPRLEFVVLSSSIHLLPSSYSVSVFSIEPDSVTLGNTPITELKTLRRQVDTQMRSAYKNVPSRMPDSISSGTAEKRQWNDTSQKVRHTTFAYHHNFCFVLCSSLSPSDLVLRGGVELRDTN